MAFSADALTLVLPSVCLIHEKSCSQRQVLPQGTDEARLGRRDVCFEVDRVWISVVKSRDYAYWQAECQSGGTLGRLFENRQVEYLSLLKMEQKPYQSSNYFPEILFLILIFIVLDLFSLFHMCGCVARMCTTCVPGDLKVGRGCQAP